MSENHLSPKLPSEFLTEKSFYTLAGASFGVFLICWLANTIGDMIDIKDYRIYVFLAIILSGVFAVIIMFQNKERKAIHWLLTVINGILIFMNATGANVLTAQQTKIFDKPQQDSTNNGGAAPINTTKFILAGIFPLPHMAPWFPDEKLIEQSEQLKQQNEVLVKTNKQLALQISQTSGERELQLRHITDSLNKVIDELKRSLPTSNTDKSKELTACINEREEFRKSSKNYKDSLDKFIPKFTELQGIYDSKSHDYDDLVASSQRERNNLNNQNTDLQKSLSNSNKNRSIDSTALVACKKETMSLQSENNMLTAENKDLRVKLSSIPSPTTLTEHIAQFCGKPLTPAVPNRKLSADESLIRQKFWSDFCVKFGIWRKELGY